jgi:hypothetical protein
MNRQAFSPREPCLAADFPDLDAVRVNQVDRFLIVPQPPMAISFTDVETLLSSPKSVDDRPISFWQSWNIVDSVRTITRRSHDASNKNKISDRIFVTLRTASFPLAVTAPLVEIEATILPSALTASKSKTPPDVRFSLSRLNLWPNWRNNHSLRTQPSTSSWTVV